MQRRLFALSLLAGSISLTAGCGGGGEGTDAPAPAPAPAPGPGPGTGGGDPATGTFAYVARSDTRDVVAHQVLASGTLRFLGAVAAARGTKSVTVHPSGRFAYAMNSAGQSISVYERHPTEGILEFKSSLGIPSHQVINGFRLHPSGQLAYVAADNRIQLLSVNGDTGALQLEGFVQDGAVNLDVHPTGDLLYTQSSLGFVSAWRVVNNALERVNLESSVGVPSGLVVAPSGRFLYVTSRNEGISVHPVDVQSGRVGATTQTRSTKVIGPIAIHPSGRFAYAAGFEQSADGSNHRDGIHIIQIDTETGLLSVPTFEPVESAIASLTISPSGRSLYTATGAAGTVSGFTLDEANGALTRLTEPASVGGNAAGITLF